MTYVSERDTRWHRSRRYIIVGSPSVASPAMGHWGMCPFDFQQFHFTSPKSDWQLSKYV